MSASKHDLDAAIHLLRTHGYDETLRRTGVTGSALRSAFRRAGLDAPSSYANAQCDLKRDTDPVPAGADVSGLDYEDDATEVEGHAATATDPVARREAQDRTAQLRREHEQLVERLREAHARQRVLDALDAHHDTPRILPREKSSGVREMAAVALLSDLHVEETVDPAAIAGRNAYSLAIAEQRLRRAFDAMAALIDHHRASRMFAVRDLVLWLGGDLMSGRIHPELVESGELSPTQTVLWLLPRLRDGIATTLDRCQLERLVVPCSYGNHGRTTEKPHISTGAHNSYEWLLYHALADSFRGNDRVQFEITPSAHQYVEVFGKTLHFHHGDDIKFGGGIGGLSIPLLKRVPVWNDIRRADVHHIGHFHQFRDYGHTVVNGSLIGYNAYAQRIGAPYEPPQQAFYLLDSKRGKTNVTPLWVEEREAA